MAFLMNNDDIVSSREEAQARAEAAVKALEQALERAYRWQDMVEIRRCTALLQGARRDAAMYQ